MNAQYLMLSHAAVTSRIRRVERRASSNLGPVSQYRPRHDACASIHRSQSLGKTRASDELYNQPVCVRSIQETSRRRRRPRPRSAWPTGHPRVRDARVAGFAQRSHRHRLPPRTDEYVPGGKRTEGSQDPGTRRTPARWSSAKPAQSTTGGAARADHANTRPAALAPNAPHERSPRVWRRAKLPRARNKGCPSQRHRRGAATKTTTKDGPPAAPIINGPRRRRPRLQQQFRPRQPQGSGKSQGRRVGFVHGEGRREHEQREAVKYLVLLSGPG